MNGNNYVPYQNGLISGKLLSKFSVGNSDTYVLNSITDSGIQTRFAVALSDYSIQVYGTDNHRLSVHTHEKNVTDIKFSQKNPALLFSSSLDGKINVWDSRCKSPVQTFFEDSDGGTKPLSCFDCNLDEQLICAGTEMIREDSFLLFWDRRTSDVLGGYWNSHTDEITQIHFHPSINSVMASSSLDGLINIFDLNQRTEEDALMHTLNAACAINKLCWINSDSLACITSIEEYQLWSSNEASPMLSVSREDLSKSKLKVDYIIDKILIADSWFLVTGTYEGLILLWYPHQEGLKPVGCLMKGHSCVVRTICYNSKEDIILTGGEDGYICYWKISLNS